MNTIGKHMEYKGKIFFMAVISVSFIPVLPAVIPEKAGKTGIFQRLKNWHVMMRYIVNFLTMWMVWIQLMQRIRFPYYFEEVDLFLHRSRFL